MAIDINSINLNKIKQQTAQHSENPDASKVKQDNADESRVTRDRVEISQKADELDKLQNRIMSSDSFDEQRVNEIATAIAEGRYPVDHERIAQKFLELESTLYE